MTLEQLRIFLAVAQHLHFTRAADSLYLTQPAVSAAIGSLETEYGVKLFHRIGRRIEVTEAGKFLQAEAPKILEQVSLTQRGLRELNNLQRGELKIGASFTIGNYWLPDKISQFTCQYPSIVVNCTLANAEDIGAGTASGQFDIGLIAGDIKPALKSCLQQEVVGSDRLRIVVGPSHPWFEREKVLLEELMTTAWIMRESGSGTQQMFEQALEKWGIVPGDLQVVLVLNSSEMVKAVVEGGVGAAAVPELMVKKEIQVASLRAIKVIDSQHNNPLDIVRHVFKLKHPKRFQTQMARAFEAILAPVASRCH